ncbi:MAG: murein L,D-transpeptidase catalytic domain-containing protein [Acetobacteraceae bacterium]
MTVRPGEGAGAARAVIGRTRHFPAARIEIHARGRSAVIALPRGVPLLGLMLLFAATALTCYISAEDVGYFQQFRARRAETLRVAAANAALRGYAARLRLMLARTQRQLARAQALIAAREKAAEAVRAHLASVEQHLQRLQAAAQAAAPAPNASAPAAQAQRGQIAPSAYANPHAGKHLKPLAETIHAQAPNISPNAILIAINAYFDVKRRHLTDKPLVTIVDYSLPSAKKRLAVVDVQTGKVLFYTYVAQGKGSGLRYATHFSNEPGTDASSLGVYLTGDTYYGKHGYSLRLYGLDPGFNSAAYRRDIVIHSAWYVSKTFAQEHGRMGQSWGCFALSRKVESAIVRLIRGDTVLVGYYPDPKWLHSSPFLNGLPAASARKYTVTAARAS